jgi:hypothetical protein
LGNLPEFFPNQFEPQ